MNYAVQLAIVADLKSFNEVMKHATRNNWTEELLVEVCKQKFGRIRQGVGNLRKSYRAQFEKGRA